MQKTSWLFVDLDGTLIDTLPYLTSVFFEFGKKAGITLTKEDFALCNGPSIREVVMYLKEKFHLPDSVEELENLYHEKLRNIRGKFRPRPYAKAALKKLRAQGWKCALVTSARKSYAVDFLRRNGMSDLFDFLACGDEVQNAKPDPEIYELAKKRAGNGYFIALEDSENGIQAAKNAGCVALRFEAGNTESFFSVSSFRDLCDRQKRKILFYTMGRFL
ncbi:MAG: HAD-IA family hydrolase [Candidatus Spechtbacteria bacterium]|nr:HAD-IA family hydrolase [Candidatus Spechtbacteria bacterium]